MRQFNIEKFIKAYFGDAEKIDLVEIYYLLPKLFKQKTLQFFADAMGVKAASIPVWISNRDFKPKRLRQLEQLLNLKPETLYVSGSSDEIEIISSISQKTEIQEK